MPFGPADVAKHNPLIKTDRHMNMWLDMVNAGIKRGRPEQVAIDEANSAINMDMARSRVMSNPGTPLRDADPGFSPQRSAPGESSMVPGEPFNREVPYTASPGDPENTLPAGREQPTQRPYQTQMPSSPGGPAEQILERFPYDPIEERLRAQDEEKKQQQLAPRPIKPGTKERFLDPTKVIT